MTLILSLCLFNLGFLAGAWWATHLVGERGDGKPSVEAPPDRSLQLPPPFATSSVESYTPVASRN